MAKFCFQVEGQPEVVRRELHDIQEAKCAAVHLVAETLCKHPQSFWDADAHQVRVTDEQGMTLFLLDLFTTTSPAIQASVQRRA